MRITSVVALLAFLNLGLPLTAAAEAQTRLVVARSQGLYEQVIDCADYGPFDFNNTVAGWQRLSVTEVHDADGTLQKLVISTTFRESDTNADTGLTVSLRGSFTQINDFAAGTLTLTGNVATGRLPDGTTYLREIGRLVMTLDARDPLFVAGRHQALEAGGINPVVCRALAEPAELGP